LQPQKTHLPLDAKKFYHPIFEVRAAPDGPQRSRLIAAGACSLVALGRNCRNDDCIRGNWSNRDCHRKRRSLNAGRAPLGNATLSIVSGFPAQLGAPNPFAGRQLRRAQIVQASQAHRTKTCGKVRGELRLKTSPEPETALQRDAKGASTQNKTES
jgi:hypothetical protein